MIAKPDNLTVNLIVAMDEGRGIGKEGKIPWHVSADLKRFKALTMGHPIVMGRKTWESIGMPLPGRTSIVITRQDGYRAEGAVVAGTVEEALAEAAKRDTEAYVIGGAEIYGLVLPSADRILMTRVSGTHDADTFFPEFEDAFKEVRSEEVEDGGHRLRYADYERIAER